MLEDDVYVSITQPLGHETCVRRHHVSTRVAVRSAQNHRQERPLLRGLLIHVHIVKESRDAIVGQHTAIEEIHGLIDGGGAAQLLVQCHVSSESERVVSASWSHAT